MTIKALACPRCGSTDLEEVTWNRRRCRHCGTESMLTSDRTRLQLVEWVCPSCGFNNESGTAYCGQCGARLTKRCPNCSNQIRIDLQFCNFCGANYEGVLAERFEERRHQAIAALDKSRKAQAGKTGWKAILLGCGAYYLLFGVLAFLTLALPAAILGDVEHWPDALVLVLALFLLIIPVALAIWFARRKRSQWLEQLDQELASKRQALEESLAQEYGD